MKILLFSRGYPDQRQPFFKTFIRDEALLLSRMHELMVLDGYPFRPGNYFTEEHSPSYPYDGFPVRRARYFSVPRQKLPWLTSRGIGRRMTEAISEFEPDVVHAHQLYPGILALQAAQAHGVPTVLTLHGADLYQGLQSKALRNLAEKVLSKTGHIICVGPRLQADTIRAFPAIASKTETVLHGIDYDFFRPAPVHTSQGFECSGLQYPRILCVARFVEKKGHMLLLQAVAASEVLRRCAFTLIGDASDPQCFRMVKAAVSELGLSNIRFMPGLDRMALREAYYAHDFYVQPSLDEPFGLALLEAIACGLPAVSFRSGGPETIITPANGKLVDTTDAPSLQAALEYMADAYQNYDRQAMHADLKNRLSSDSKRERLNRIYSMISGITA